MIKTRRTRVERPLYDCTRLTDPSPVTTDKRLHCTFGVIRRPRVRQRDGALCFKYYAHRLIEFTVVRAARRFTITPVTCVRHGNGDSRCAVFEKKKIVTRIVRASFVTNERVNVRVFKKKKKKLV